MDLEMTDDVNEERDYPQVKQVNAAQGFEAALQDLVAIFQPFVERFGVPPDERGLTDRFLFFLTKYTGAMRLERFTISQETKNGCDYCIKFWTINPQKSEPEKRAIYLQAKSYKVDKQATDWLVADFMAKTSSGAFQMNLVADTVTGGKTTGVTVIGGYLLYAPDCISFVPLSKVHEKARQFTKAYGELPKGDSNLKGSAELYCNRMMSKFFYTSRTSWLLQDLFTSQG